MVGTGQLKSSEGAFKSVFAHKWLADGFKPKKMALLSAVAACGILLSGCAELLEQNDIVSSTPSSQGSFTDPNQTAQLGEAGQVPPNVLNIPGVPIPDGVLVSLSDTVIVGADESWTGQVVLTSTQYKPVQLVEYMRKAMPAYGWVETAIVRSRRTSITFVSADRYATLRIQPLGTGSEIDLVVSPAGQTRATLNTGSNSSFQPRPVSPPSSTITSEPITETDSSLNDEATSQ